jgi:hypothetical protein
MVTSNHIHLLVANYGDQDAIPDYMQLVAGRTGLSCKINNKGKFFVSL